MRGRARQSECVYVCVCVACILDSLPFDVRRAGHTFEGWCIFYGGYLCEYLHLRDAISSVCACVCLCMHAWIGCIAQPVQTRKVNAVG